MSRNPLLHRRSLAIASCLICLVVSTAHSARAEDLIFSLEQRIGGDSNVFRDENDETSDGTYQIRPSVLLRQREGQLTYALSYTPVYEVFFDTNDVDGDDHYVTGRLGYAPTPASEIGFRLDFADYRSIRTDEVLGSTGVLDVVPGISGRVQRLLLVGDGSVRVERDTVVEVEVGLTRYEFSTPNNSDNIGGYAELGFIHEPRSNYGIGAALFGSYRDFDERSGEPGSHNTVLHPSIVIRAEPIESLTFEAAVGPAWVATRTSRPGSERVDRFFGSETATGTEAAIFFPPFCDQISGQVILDTCAQLPAPALNGRLDEQVLVPYADGLRPGSDDDDLVTVFASARITKTESWGLMAVEFFRREDSAGAGVTTVRNSVSAEIVVRPADYWTLELGANWNRRRRTTDNRRNQVGAGPSDVPSAIPGFFYAEAVSLVPDGSDSVDVDQYVANATVIRQLTEGLSVSLSGRFLRQEREGSTGLPQRSFETWSGWFGLRYEFLSVGF